MPNIESLTAHADRLEKSFNDWNHAYLVLVAVTAFFVFLTFVAQWIASGKSGELDRARMAVIAAKDDQLKEEFTHRDERIAKVKADGDVQIAAVKAGSDEKIAAANKRSEEIAADSNRKAEQLRAQNLDTSTKLVAAQRALEEEKIARIKIEQYFAPRTVDDSHAAMLKAGATPLKGRNLIVFVQLTDPETGIFGDRLSEILKSAGLSVEIKNGFKQQPVAGLTIEAGDGRLKDAEILATALISAGLAERPMPVQLLTATQKDVLTLFVGPKH